MGKEKGNQEGRRERKGGDLEGKLTEVDTMSGKGWNTR